MNNTALKLVHNANGKRDYINRLIQAEPRSGVLFSDFISQTVERKKKKKGESYSKCYQTLIMHLKNFSEKYEANIYTNSINEDFIDDFILYLEERDLRQNYIKNLLTLVKAMASKAGRYGYAVDQSFDDITMDDEEIFTVYLSMNEITRIYFYQGLTSYQEKIRDLFIVGCLTALRYSDYSTLTKQNFTRDYIVKITKKTNKKVIIPLHDYVREIYNKYDGEVSEGLSIQHFNRYIKMITEKVGLNELITYNYTKGGKLVTETKPKFKLISSHTARRSAATNMYMTGRLKAYEIMQLTGHTTEKSFFRYIRTSDADKAKQIAGDSFFRK